MAKGRDRPRVASCEEFVSHQAVGNICLSFHWIPNHSTSLSKGNRYCWWFYAMFVYIVHALQLLSTYIIIYSSISVTVLHSFDGLAILYANILFVITCEYLFTFFEFRLRKWFHYLFFLVAVMISFRLNLLRNGEKNLLYQVLFCWFNARCFSSSVDLLTDGGLFDSSILVRLSYLFYLPPSFFGPFYHYSDYAPQVSFINLKSFNSNIVLFIVETTWSFIVVNQNQPDHYQNNQDNSYFILGLCFRRSFASFSFLFILSVLHLSTSTVRFLEFGRLWLLIDHFVLCQIFDHIWNATSFKWARWIRW